MANPVVQQIGERQLALYEAGNGAVGYRSPDWRIQASGLCAGCRAREAHYAFRKQRRGKRWNILCFRCFYSEMSRRQDVAERMARGSNTIQAGLPLEETLEMLCTRRRRAQIASRHALKI